MVEPKNRGRTLGLHQTGGSASFLVTPLLAAALATTLGWRGSFISLAIITMIFGVIFYILLGRRKGTAETDHKITDSVQEEPQTQGQWRRLIILIFMSTFVGAMVMSVGAFIPLFMVDHFGVSEGQAAVFLAILYSTGIVASPLGGYLADRFGTIPVMLGASLSAGPVIFLLNLAPYGLGISLALIVLGMTLFLRLAAAESYIISHTSARYRSTTFGAYYFFSMESGGVLTPVIGYLIDQFGFHLSFTIMGAAAVAVSLTCIMLLKASRS
jgi:predicted MFS family arabinose efflux permease